MSQLLGAAVAAMHDLVAAHSTLLAAEAAGASEAELMAAADSVTIARLTVIRRLTEAGWTPPPAVAAVAGTDEQITRLGVGAIGLPTA